MNNDYLSLIKRERGEKGKCSKEIVNSNCREESYLNTLFKISGNKGCFVNSSNNSRFNNLTLDKKIGDVNYTESNIIMRIHNNNLCCRSGINTLTSGSGLNILEISSLRGDLSEEFNLFSVKEGGIVKNPNERLKDFSYKFSFFVILEPTQENSINLGVLTSDSEPCVIMSKLVNKNSIEQLKLFNTNYIKLYFESGKIYPSEFSLETIFKPYFYTSSEIEEDVKYEIVISLCSN